MKALVSGAGIAGPTLAFFLRRAGIKTTVVERSPSLRTAGQIIDIRGAGLTVVKRMASGVEDAIRAQITHERGLAFVDPSNKWRAQFPTSSNAGSFSAEIEILRGDLAKVFFDASEKEGAEYRFGDYVTSIDEREGSVRVTFEKGGREEDFDIVVAADGMSSKTRSFVFPDVELKSLGQYTCYFTIPPGNGDESGWARWYNAKGGRCILLKPDKVEATRAYLSIMSESPQLTSHATLSVVEQKALMRDLFTDAGWEASRVLEGMEKAEDFYMQTVAQVQMPSWHKGRTALLGDAGYCPSPISGMGTSLAIVGAYVLAGELSKCDGDYNKAFEEYESIMRPYVTKAQNLPPGAPGIANPQTEWGINILYGVLSFADKSGLAKLVGMLGWGSKSEGITLPEYQI